jgi:hypothetical protein
LAIERGDVKMKGMFGVHFVCGYDLLNEVLEIMGNREACATEVTPD